MAKRTLLAVVIWVLAFKLTAGIKADNGGNQSIFASESKTMRLNVTFLKGNIFSNLTLGGNASTTKIKTTFTKTLSKTCKCDCDCAKESGKGKFDLAPVDNTTAKISSICSCECLCSDPCTTLPSLSAFSASVPDINTMKEDTNSTILAARVNTTTQPSNCGCKCDCIKEFVYVCTCLCACSSSCTSSATSSTTMTPSTSTTTITPSTSTSSTTSSITTTMTSSTSTSTMTPSTTTTMTPTTSTSTLTTPTTTGTTTQNTTTTMTPTTSTSTLTTPTTTDTTSQSTTTSSTATTTTSMTTSTTTATTPSSTSTSTATTSTTARATTTSTSTTPVPLTTSANPSGDYIFSITEDGVTCIKFKGSIDFDISYTTDYTNRDHSPKTGTISTSQYQRDEFNVSGSCKGNQSMMIQWGQGDQMSNITMAFSSDSNAWSLKSLQSSLFLDPKVFKGAGIANSTMKISSMYKLKPSPVAFNKSFSCKKTLKASKVDGTINGKQYRQTIISSIHGQPMQIQAYSKKTNEALEWDNGFDDAVQCSIGSCITTLASMIIGCFLGAVLPYLECHL